jgi:superfamily II DNA or RNA helicase
MKREEIQKNALNATLNLNRCGLALGTGVGKTLVGLTHAERENASLKSILIVAPKLSVLDSWKKQAVKHKKEHVLANAEFTTYLSLNKKDPKAYDIVYLDECHNLLDSHRAFLNEYKGMILGLTGTPPKKQNSEKGRMVSTFCPMVYTYVVDEAVEDNILNDYRIIVHKLQLNTKNILPVVTKKKTFYTSEINNYKYWSGRIEMAKTPKQIQLARIMRMKAMMEYSSKEVYAKKLLSSIQSKCIIFANTQKQAEKLCTYSYHSNNPDSEENLKLFEEGKINKLSCVLQLSEGVNIPNLRQGIIMHAYGNERKSSQRIGRLLRLNPDETAIVHILCYVDTVDETWVKEALEGYAQDKIEWRTYNIDINE